MEAIREDLSFVGLTIQVAGVASLAGLFLLLYRALPRRYFLLWSQAWAVMAAALLCLRLAVHAPRWLWPLEILYYVGEYRFAQLLRAGFALYPEREPPTTSEPRWPWVLATAWGILLITTVPGFAVRFSLHALVLGTLLLLAVPELHRLTLPRGHGWARTFAGCGLSLLAFDFFANGALQIAVIVTRSNFDLGYSAYQSIVDLFIEVLLAFGLVAVATVDMRATLERARTAMESERDRMLMLAHQDALTGCFNRRALEELNACIGARRGSVAVVDMNDLKMYNDRHGHALGDLAICQVANALKGIVRRHDHVFRIGGDEFVLLSFDLPAEIALERLAGVQAALEQVVLVEERRGLGIAYGVAEFADGTAVEKAMADADAAMYAHKRAART